MWTPVNIGAYESAACVERYARRDAENSEKA